MDIHEYQAKHYLQQHGIDVGEFFVAGSLEELKKEYERHPYHSAVIKAQVHAGGRGKAGGIKLAHSKEELFEETEKMLGMKLITKQTGAEGKPVEKVLVAPLSKIEREFYFGITVDRAQGRVCVMLSAQGGVNIEEVAEKDPRALYKIYLRSPKELRKDHLWNMARALGLKEKETLQSAFKLFPQLVEAFFAADASLLEINPLILTQEGKLFCLDARMSIDDNALYRQEQLRSYFDPSQRSVQEVESSKHDLSYIALDGTIGCMVNGAGLAMATMDIIDYYGGRPANFLDVGGSATEEKIAAGFEILASDPKVKAILVNIFGGIMSCATIAKGVLGALEKQEIALPLIVRLEGTSVEEGRSLMGETEHPGIFTASNLAQAAQLAVEKAV